MISKTPFHLEGGQSSGGQGFILSKKIALVLLPPFWPNSPPLGLAALKGFLNKHNLHVDSIDFNNRFFNKASGELKKQWCVSCNKRLEDNIIYIMKEEYSTEFNKMIDRLLGYDVIGFSCYKSNLKTTVKISGILKSKNPNIKIIYGGPEITRQYFKLNGNITKDFGNLSDFLVVGEGELSLVDYLTGKINGSRITEFYELENLGELPSPDYSDFNFSNYPRKTSVSLMYSRGCIRRCRFCSERLLNKKFRVCPEGNIINQIRGHKKKGIEYFVLHDSLINGDIKALELLCNGIIKNFSSIKWEAQITVRKDMPDRLLKKIKNSGCYNLFIGLESGCDRTLKNMNKGFTSGEAAGFFKKLKSAGLSFGISIITGYPGETLRDHKESLNFILSHKDLIPKIEQVNPYTYYEGTGLPESADYRNNPESLKRADQFINRIKDAGFKHTNAFMLNLIEP